jgi:hypothetical protein
VYEKEGTFGVRRHDAALLRRDVSRLFLECGGKTPLCFDATCRVSFWSAAARRRFAFDATCRVNLKR